MRVGHSNCEVNINLSYIKKESRLKYYEALDNIHPTGNYPSFVKLVTKFDVEMLKRYLELLAVRIEFIFLINLSHYQRLKTHKKLSKTKNS